MYINVMKGGKLCFAINLQNDSFKEAVARLKAMMRLGEEGDKDITFVPADASVAKELYKKGELSAASVAGA